MSLIRSKENKCGYTETKYTRTSRRVNFLIYRSKHNLFVIQVFDRFMNSETL